MFYYIPTILLRFPVWDSGYLAILIGFRGLVLRVSGGRV